MNFKGIIGINVETLGGGGERNMKRNHLDLKGSGNPPPPTPTDRARICKRLWAGNQFLGSLKVLQDRQRKLKPS